MTSRKRGKSDYFLPFNLICIFLCICTANAQSEWSKPIPLPKTSPGNIFGIGLAIDSKDHLHCVWDQDADTLVGGDNIFYSFWDGKSWSFPINISNTSNPSLYPKIIIDSLDHIYVFWGEKLQILPDYPYNRVTDIFYSKWDGQGWSNPASIYHEPSSIIYSNFLNVAEPRQDSIHLIFSEMVWFPEPSMKHIWGDGTFWKVETIPYTDGEFYPSFCIGDDNRLHLLYIGLFIDLEGNNDVLYGSRVNSEWKLPQVLVHRSDGMVAQSFETQIAVDDDKRIHALWFEDFDGDWYNDDILYASSMDGLHWSEAENISKYNDSVADLWFINLIRDDKNHLHSVWEKELSPSTKSQICYMEWDGDKWLEEEDVLDNPQSVNSRPKIAIDKEGKIHLVWLKYYIKDYGRVGDTIFYATKSPGGINISKDPIKTLRLSTFPNPFKEFTEIHFQVLRSSFVNLTVYDATGRLVRTLLRTQNLEPGIYKLRWDGKDEKGKPLPRGIYFIQLETPNSSLTSKVVVLR